MFLAGLAPFTLKQNPVSAITAGVRQLSGAPGPVAGPWPHPRLDVLLLAVFAPLSVRRYARVG